MEVSCKVIGMEKVEWAVRPPGRRREAMPEDATHKTILPSARIACASVLQVKDLPIPKPSVKKNY